MKGEQESTLLEAFEAVKYQFENRYCFNSDFLSTVPGCTFLSTVSTHTFQVQFQHTHSSNSFNTHIPGQLYTLNNKLYTLKKLLQNVIGIIMQRQISNATILKWFEFRIVLINDFLDLVAF